MRKWLMALDWSMLYRISHDLGYEGHNKAEAVDFIMESAKDHGFKIDDFKARYQIG
jgi:hypothetical protein